MNFLVIDIGTSGCRAAVVSANGTVLSQSRRSITVDQPRASFAELDTDRLWCKVIQVIRSEVDRHPDLRFDAIGVSALLGYVFLDRAQEPLMPAITYADNRAFAETEEIRQLFGDQEFLAITGRRPSPLLLAPKIRWLAKHRSDIVNKLAHIIGLKDEIVRRLSGKIQTDVAHLDYTGLYNVYTGKLESDLLTALRIKRKLFSAPTPATAVAGTLTAAAAGRLGLTEGTPVISGSSDGTTAMYGAGILDDGKGVLVSGTTDVLMRCCRPAPVDPSAALSVNTGMVRGTRLIGGPLGLSGGSLHYFEVLLQTSASKLEKEIAALHPGSDGLLIFPGLTGERSPYWKEHMTGTIAGLRPVHRSEHLLRAVMEGCALRILNLLKILSQNRLLPRVVNVVGGGANLDVWNQIRSDICGLEIHKLAVTEATCLGTAMFCKAGLDKAQSLQAIADDWITVAKKFRPNQEHKQTYEKLARLFDDHIEANAGLYQGLIKFRQQPVPGADYNPTRQSN